MDRMSLGKPALMGERVLVGTDTDGTSTQWLICLDASDGDAKRDCILGSCALGGEFQDAAWIHPELCLVTAGEAGQISLYTVSRTNQLALHGHLPPIHTAMLRELAVNSANRAQFASGGYDRKLCLVDLERPDTLQTLPQEGVISSVRWPACNQNVCPSITLDDGTFLIFDNRVRPVGPPAFRATMGKKELFGHERYTDHNVLLGFGDGEIQHIDVRVTDRILHKVKDPLVGAIGSIQFDYATNRILISGLTSTTVWNFDPHLGEVRLLCDASRAYTSTDVLGSDTTSHSAVFMPGGEAVVNCSSLGEFGIAHLPKAPTSSSSSSSSSR